MIMSQPNRLFLLDAYALIYRAYYAFIKNPRINSKGQNTSAVFGFVNTLEDLINRENPSHIAVCFDPHGPTFRHEAFEQYKAQREETPEVIRWSVPVIKEIITAYRIPILEVAGFEADDVIGTMSRKAENAGYDVYMMTPDKDCGQLVTPHVWMYRPKYGSNDFEILGPEEVNQKYSLTNPKQMIDLLGLMGDSSDNIPGCPGIGEVTAKKLLAEFGSIDSLLQHTDQLKGSLKEKVTNNLDLIRFSKFLATIRLDVPVDFNEKALRRESPDMEEMKRIFESLEFRTMINRIGKTMPAPVPMSVVETTVKKTLPPDHQFSLWDEPALFSTDTQKNPGLTLSEKNQSEEKSDFLSTKSFYPSVTFVNPSEETDEKIQTTLSCLQTTPNFYHLIDNEDVFVQFLKLISSEKSICLDTETTGVEPMTAELVGMSFSWKKNEAWYLPLSTDQEETKKIVSRLKPVFENPSIRVIGQNIKYDLVVLKKYDLTIKGELFDTMIAHYLLQPELRHNMDYLAEIYLHYKTIHIDELIGPKGKNQLNMRDIPQTTIFPYASEDADITFQLQQVLEPEITASGLDYLCREVEMPLIKVLAEMEFNGVGIDIDSLKQSSIQMTYALDLLEKEIQELAGITFNVNSPKQTGDILFDHLGIDKKAKKTKTGQYSTSEDVLEGHKTKHPIVEKILEQRGLKKLLSTYIDALPELIHPKTGRIHTSYNQAVTATGRLSSSNPNLQNIPIRDTIGRDIRKAFTCGPDEYFVSADYSQIELRLMAHLSGDSSMIEAFENDQDIHAATAAKIYQIPLGDVTADMRRKAKTANFGIIYGISVFGLAERMGVSRSEAKELIDGYFNTYPNVKTYMDKAIQDAKTNGWVETLFHRKRYLPDIQSHNAVVRGYAERNAINAPIQGSAADIIKIAMVRIQRAIDEKGLRSKMILQVHDELNFIVPKEELEPLKTLIRQEMESAVELKVPLKADIGYGTNWLEAH